MSEANRIRVVIADDQALVRTGFRLILEVQDDIEVVGEGGDGEEAVRVVRRCRPDIVLMDVRMPGLDGIAATHRILVDGGAVCRVVMLTTFDLDEYVYAALRAGASGFLLKDVSAQSLVGSVRLVAAGDALLAPSITRRLVERFTTAGTAADSAAMASLTGREREILVLLGRGRSNAEIASRLSISATTVKTHVGRILPKLHLRDRAQAVVFAYESGLVTPGR